MSIQNQESPKQSQLSRQEVLGLLRNRQQDEFSIGVKLQFSPKSGKNGQGPSLTKETVEDAVPQILTERLLSKQATTVLDPLGLITPFMVQGKLQINSYWLTQQMHRQSGMH